MRELSFFKDELNLSYVFYLCCSKILTCIWQYCHPFWLNMWSFNSHHALPLNWSQFLGASHMRRQQKKHVCSISLSLFSRATNGEWLTHPAIQLLPITGHHHPLTSAIIGWGGEKVPAVVSHGLLWQGPQISHSDHRLLSVSLLTSQHFYRGWVTLTYVSYHILKKTVTQPIWLDTYPH